jgi:hypothetical protein
VDDVVRLGVRDLAPPPQRGDLLRHRPVRDDQELGAGAEIRPVLRADRVEDSLLPPLVHPRLEADEDVAVDVVRRRGRAAGGAAGERRSQQRETERKSEQESEHRAILSSEGGSMIAAVLDHRPLGEPVSRKPAVPPERVSRKLRNELPERISDASIGGERLEFSGRGRDRQRLSRDT